MTDSQFSVLVSYACGHISQGEALTIDGHDHGDHQISGQNGLAIETSPYMSGWIPILILGHKLLLKCLKDSSGRKL